MIEDGKFDFHNGSRNNSSCERQHASGSCVPAPQYRFLTNSFFVVGTVEEGSSLLVARAAGWEQEVARRKYYEPPIGPSLRTNSRADLLIASEVGFVFQRPQHLMIRFARIIPVLFVEERVFDDIAPARLELHPITSNLTVGVPHLPRGVDTGAAADRKSTRLNSSHV